MTVIKRDGRKAKFDKDKIKVAVLKAFIDVDGEETTYAKEKAKDIANYLRLSEISEEDEKDIELFLNIAKNYIENYTGIPQKSEDEQAETLDTYSDFIIVIYVLCQDMYDNRKMYVDGKSINNTVKTILDMHTRNNL